MAWHPIGMCPLTGIDLFAYVLLQLTIITDAGFSTGITCTCHMSHHAHAHAHAHPRPRARANGTCLSIHALLGACVHAHVLGVSVRYAV